MISGQLPLVLWEMDGVPEAGPSLLPGAEDLLAFSSLWETEEPSDPDLPDRFSETEHTSVRDLARDRQVFKTPGLLPGSRYEPAEANETGYEEVETASEPSREALKLSCSFTVPAGAERTVLVVPPLMGMGELFLNGVSLLSFCSLPGAGKDTFLNRERAIEITSLLSGTGQEQLEISFESVRPAGFCDVFTVRFLSGGMLTLADARREFPGASLTLQVHAFEPGTFRIRFTPFFEIPVPSLPEETLTFDAPDTRLLSVSLPFRGKVPGSYRIQLIRTVSGKEQTCDTLTLPMGRAPRAPAALLPVPPEEAVQDPEMLSARLAAIGKPGLFTTVPFSSGLLSTLMDAGIPVGYPPEKAEELPPELRIHPAVFFSDPPLPLHAGLGSAWQLCGLISQPRPLPADAWQTLRADLFGPQAAGNLPPSFAARLAELHLLYLRHHAESIRQGAGKGALCSPGEWEDPQVQEVLAEVFQTCHLSIAPLYGAWYAGASLVFTLRLFLPDGTAPEHVRVELVLDGGLPRPLYEETFSGEALCKAAVTRKVPLPDSAWTCRLQGRLFEADSILETVSFPVFVGLSAPLEAVLPPGRQVYDPGPA